MPGYITIITDTLVDLEAENAALKKELNTTENKLTGSRLGCHTLQETIRSLSDALDMERASNRRLGEEAYGLRATTLSLRCCKSALQKKLNEAKNNTADPELLEALNKQISDLQEGQLAITGHKNQKIAELTAKLEEAKSTIKTAGKSIVYQGVAIDKKNTELASANRLIESLEEKVKQQDASINLLGADINTLKQQLYVKRYPAQDLLNSQEQCAAFAKSLKDCQQVNTDLRHMIAALEIKVNNDRQKMTAARGMLS